MLSHLRLLSRKMQRIVDSNKAKELDRYTIDNKFATEGELIDSAGKQVAQFVLENVSDIFNSKVLVLAGKGNNGADAIAAHSYINSYGVLSDLFLATSYSNKDTLKKYSVPSFYSSDKDLMFDEYDIIVDGLFGVGVNRTISDKMLVSIIDKINSLPEDRLVISIDIASGICASSGRDYGGIEADITLAIGLPKVGHFINDGARNCGVLDTLDIGFPDFQGLNDCPAVLTIDDIRGFLANDRGYNSWLEQRSTSNKYSNGVSLLYTSKVDMENFPGANILCLDAIVSSGVGMAYSYISDKIDNLPDLRDHVPEAILLDRLDTRYIDKIDSALVRDENSSLLSSDVPKVCDGPALAAIELGKNLDKAVLTPHLGELISYFGIQKEHFILKPIAVLKELAREKLYENTLVLKGPNTIILTRDEMYVVDFGSDVLATAGSGDILAGIITSMLSKGLSIQNAAIAGVGIHSLASVFYAEAVSDKNLRASSICQFLPDAASVFI